MNPFSFIRYRAPEKTTPDGRRFRGRCDACRKVGSGYVARPKARTVDSSLTPPPPRFAFICARCVSALRSGERAEGDPMLTSPKSFVLVRPDKLRYVPEPIDWGGKRVRGSAH